MGIHHISKFLIKKQKKDAAKNEWVAGRQYNLDIVLNKTGINVTGCEIKPWEEVNGGTLQQNNKQTNNNQQL